MRGGGRGAKTAPSLHRHWDPWYGIRSVLARTKRRLAIACELRWLRRVMVSQARQASLPVREIVIGWGAFIPFAAWRASSWPYISLPYSLPLSCAPRDHPTNSFWKVQISDYRHLLGATLQNAAHRIAPLLALMNQKAKQARRQPRHKTATPPAAVSDPWYDVKAAVVRTKWRVAIACNLHRLRRVMEIKAHQASLPDREIVVGCRAFIPFAAQCASL
jgi:hypothetical protein